METLLQGTRALGEVTTVASGHSFAESVGNLVVGPTGPGYGDTDRDGKVAGKVADGLLPGLAGAPGLASDDPNECTRRDVLGGSWADPEARWADLKERIDDWRPDNNRFPELPSHAQRVVGWSTLALGADSVAEIREYAGHAIGHVQVVQAAISDCAG